LPGLAEIAQREMAEPVGMGGEPAEGVVLQSLPAYGARYNAPERIVAVGDPSDWASARLPYAATAGSKSKLKSERRHIKPRPDETVRHRERQALRLSTTRSNF
jgi:hypothetical protein